MKIFAKAISASAVAALLSLSTSADAHPGHHGGRDPGPSSDGNGGCPAGTSPYSTGGDSTGTVCFPNQ